MRDQRAKRLKEEAGPEEESRRGDFMADRGVVLPALRGEAGGGAEATWRDTWGALIASTVTPGQG